MIKANNIQLNYGDLKVLKGVNLHIKKGEFVSIVGSSGAGKTTLLQILGTLENPTNGEVTIDGTPLAKQNLRAWQNKIGFVPQAITKLLLISMK